MGKRQLSNHTKKAPTQAAMPAPQMSMSVLFFTFLLIVPVTSIQCPVTSQGTLLLTTGY